MTKFMQKSFSVYANYHTDGVPLCDQCGERAISSVITTDGRLCEQCYQIRRKEKIKEETLSKLQDKPL